MRPRRALHDGEQGFQRIGPRQGPDRTAAVDHEHRTGEVDHCFRAAGVTRVQLEVAVANTTVITLYERLGYEVVATRAE